MPSQHKPPVRKKIHVALVSMPFGAPWMPSLALTQLQSVVRQRSGDSCRVDIHYLNLDFASWLGDWNAYDFVLSNEGCLAGLGDWLFSGIAFPENPDNTDAYARDILGRGETKPSRAHLETLLGHRRRLDRWMDQAIARHNLTEVDVVGFTALFAQTTASLAMARVIKRKNPNVTTVMGGAACEAEMGEALAHVSPALDFVFSGSALRSFPEFLDRFLSQQTPAARHPVTPGARCARPAASPSIATVIADNAALDFMPVPLDYESYLEQFQRIFPDTSRKPILLFETSRGCWWAERHPCRFCGLNGVHRRSESLSPEEARHHIVRLFQWKDRCGGLQAVDNVMPREYPQKVFAGVSIPKGLSVQYEVRVDMSEEDLKALYQSGVRILQPGIEALSGTSLRLMRKGADVFDNLVFLKRCDRLGFTLRWNLLIGFPGESSRIYAEYRRILPLLMHLPPPDGVFPVDFTRFSPYFEQAGQYGLSLKPRRSYRYIYPFGEAMRERLAYHFVDRNSDQNVTQSWLDRLNADVRNWRRRRFNLDKRTRARLVASRREDGGAVIFDSRFGDPVSYHIRPNTHRVLKTLERPMKLDDPDSTKEIEELNARGLLFHEDGRWLSLISG